MTTLLLIRHGESEWNRVGRIQGQVDTPLTAAGIEQARSIGGYLAQWLNGRSLRVYSSPLSRAYRTAAIIAEKIGYSSVDIKADGRLNDFNQGDIAGIDGWDIVAKIYPELERLRLEKPLQYHPPGGESGADFQQRLREFLSDLPDDETFNLIVSHGITNKYIRSIRRGITGPGIIALGESQDTIYRLDADRETEINISKQQVHDLKESVNVNLGARSYEIVIAPGLIENSIQHLQPIIANRRVALVSDEVVLERYLSDLAPVLDEITQQWNIYRIEGGEDAKSFAGLERLLDAMLADGVDRHAVVVAFGGGVVGDVAGFAAALLMRGIELIQIPTTLMSQVDSAVGGKNAINTRQGKNLVGSFLQPRVVLNDVSVLASLPAAELQAGYSEIIKYGLLRGETEFFWLENNVDAVMRCDEATLVEVIRMGCETKASIVSEDERDRGKRALVNLGHTFAHAFEAQAGFGSMPHGAAVAVGLIAACELSQRIGVCAAGLAERVQRHTRRAGLPVDLTELPALSATSAWRADAIYASMLHDKKTVNGNINFVLLRALGDPFISADVPAEDVRAVLKMLGAV